MNNVCCWCGHRHNQTALCAKRPTWGRRGFIALFGAGAIGAWLPTRAPHWSDVLNVTDEIFNDPLPYRLAWRPGGTMLKLYGVRDVTDIPAAADRALQSFVSRGRETA